ncbi:hypothetical protein [Lacticaseibacillus absianus]|uniref:hypothetical protein n=1 Tax=Lacticaseibacillus absianus TaxID=2729623 RepID=UPI0015C7C49F|nr:hypothetical protein [Lacticaseibacillus absianus]
MGKIGTNHTDYLTKNRQVGQMAAAVAGVKNGLNKTATNLRVNQMTTLFDLYDQLTQLVVSYGEMAVHDLAEFKKVSVHIQEDDKAAGQ